MLTLCDPRPARTCQGFSRREFLRVGSLTLGGLSLPGLMASRAAASVTRSDYVRDKSVVFLFLQGGPSHIEFFDPKLTAPSEFHSVTGEVPTAHAGITFGGTFPQLAKLAKKFSIVRSYGSQNAGHEYLDVMSARNPLKATMSALYARIAGTNSPETGMPLNTLVLPEAVETGLKLGSNFETGALPTLYSAGDLGPTYAAFNPSGGGPLQQDMQLKLSPERFDDRRNLLSNLDRIRRQVDASGALEGVDKYQQQAFEVITRGVADAFDLKQEDPATLARYDTSHLFRNEEVQRWGDMRRSTNLLGKQMLLARRLCEAGCGFVTVSDCGWDMHSNGNSPKHLGGMKWLGPQVDHAVAAFIEDIEARGLRDKVLLVVTGEMGRTPRINRDGGRDHYGELTPLLLYGGGLKMGQVIGQSDRTISRPATEPYHPRHLMATLFHVLFDNGLLRLDSSVPSDVARLIEQGQPIPELV
jgi:uncharacterized protein (DUF1501 family)